MPGLIIEYRHNGATQPESVSTMDTTQLGRLAYAELHRDSQLRVGGFTYRGYPLKKIEASGFLVIIEGLIYNSSEAEVRRALDNICRKLDDSISEVNKLIEKFIRDTDGDYLILVRTGRSGRGAIFGDRYARLPVFYNLSGGSALLSREIKPLLRSMKRISFDRQGLAEFLSWQHCFGSRTLFNEVQQLRPGEIIRFGGHSEKTCILPTDALTAEFCVSHPAPNRRAATEKLAEFFVTAVWDRVHTATAANLSLTCDLSGGYDTRAVFGALCKSGAKFQACSDALVTGDESETASTVAALFDRELSSFHAQHRVTDLPTLSGAVSETNCSVNAWTAASCLSDDKTRASSYLKPSANFMGFGGEWLRKPLRWDSRFKTVSEALSGDAYPTILPPQESCRLLGLTQGDFIEALKSRFPAHSLSGEAGARSLYFEYFSKVVNAGEENTRRFFWTLSPFWGNGFFNYHIQSLPLRWTGYRMFVDFLSELDPRLLKAPIHGSAVNLNSRFSVRAMDWRDTLRRQARKSSALRSLNRRISGQSPVAGLPQPALVSEMIMKIRSSESVRDTNLFPGKFSVDQIRGFNTYQKLQILTTLLYIDEIVAEFADRLVVEQ